MSIRVDRQRIGWQQQNPGYLYDPLVFQPRTTTVTYGRTVKSDPSAPVIMGRGVIACNTPALQEWWDAKNHHRVTGERLTDGEMDIHSLAVLQADRIEATFLGAEDEDRLRPPVHDRELDRGRRPFVGRGLGRAARATEESERDRGDEETHGGTLAELGSTILSG